MSAIVSHPEAERFNLPGYDCQMNEDAELHSSTKLQSSCAELLELNKDADRGGFFADNVDVELFPSTYSESHSYRCVCGFQLVRSSSVTSPLLAYAMRNNFQPECIGSPSFPIGNIKIQQCMPLVLNYLNSLPLDSVFIANLVAAKFVTSWDQRDCFVTLSYDKGIEKGRTSDFEGIGEKFY